ncbi:MAG: hypothetical protein ACFFDN_20120 [Candidatus Hodarchaeota archaeon]
MSKFSTLRKNMPIILLMGSLVIGPIFVLNSFNISNLENDQTFQSEEITDSDIALNSNSESNDRLKSPKEIPENLADQINVSKNTISDWTANSKLWARGYVLGETDASDLDFIITNYKSNNDWLRVFETKTCADRINYSSSIINETVKWALNYTPMFKNYSIPQTSYDEGIYYFNMWARWALNGFRYSRELNYLINKWNITSAFEGLKACRDYFGRAFYFCNPDILTCKNLFGTRWMSTSNLADCFMNIYRETGLSEALTYALKEWADLNNYYWIENPGYYKYPRSSSSTFRYEWSFIEVFFNYHKLKKLNGTLNNWNRVYIDLQNRFLAQKWSSPQWRDKVVSHCDGGGEKRLFATENAWLVLLTYFGNFNYPNQINLRNMLEGGSSLPGWKEILNSGLYDNTTYRFTHDSGDPFSDHGTSIGCLTLFLMGISPQNGPGLNVPKRCQSYAAEPFPMDVFKFLYDDHQIVIPVYGGTTLKFLYGTSYPSYTFPEDGVYTVTFGIQLLA